MKRLLALLLVGLMVQSAIAPIALAQDSPAETTPAEPPAVSDETSVPESAISAEAAAALHPAASAMTDIGQSALGATDPAAAQALAAAASASPRGPRTRALPSGPAKTAVTPQAISLPAAEGSVQGMGESFTPVLSSGTGTFSVPIALPSGRAGVQPSLSLSYSSSSGNGPLGIGWSMAVPFIARQTDRGLPRYIDRPAWHREEDRFLYNGGQELVAVDSAQAAAVDCEGYQAQTDGFDSCIASVPAELADWQQYRARVEGGFMRFFRAPDSRRWVVQSPDGTRFDFGELPVGHGPAEVTSFAANALETDEGTPGVEAGSPLARTRESGRGEGPGPRIHRWHLTRMSDSHGSTVYYRYRYENGLSWLDDIHYVSPHEACSTGENVEARRNCSAELAHYGRRVLFVWDSRPDVWSSYATGWRTSTSLRLKRIEISAAQGAPGSRSIVRRYHLGYLPAEESFHSLLSTVQVEGRRSELLFYTNTFQSWTPRSGLADTPEGSLGDTIVGDVLPPMTFGYSRPAGSARAPAGFVGFDTSLHTSGASPPHSVDESRTDLFDVNSDGLPDIVVTDPARYRTSDGRPAAGVYFNGFAGRDALPGVAGGFSDAVAVPMPTGLSGVMSLDNLNLVPMDIDGDGRSDYLHMPRLRNYGYFTPTRQPDGAMPAGADVSPAQQGWQWTYVPVALPDGVTDPRIDLGRDGARIKALDVNNDHLVDVVRTSGTEMQTWLNLGWLPDGDGRFGSAALSASGEWELSTDPITSCVLQVGIPLDFEDPEVRLADMNGDGLQDIVKVRRGRVLYWPGRGPGLWGDGPASCDRGEGDGRYIEMQTPPRELDIESSGVYLEDIDEDGAADIVQVGFRDISVWLNKAGAAFTERAILHETPPTPAFVDRVRFADIDGSGTTDILWASSDNYRWIDPMGGHQPRVLTSVDNGLGALTTLEYGSSVEDYLTDLAAAESCTDASCDRFTWSRVGGDCDARIQARTSDETGGGECAYRSGGSPVVSSVVRAVETTDRFSALGREENVSRTVFAYHDGYYEGIEQEFRGFGAADAIAIGDESHPTGITRTRFLQGRRPNAIAADRLADNPDEALKGRESLTESFDQRGTYLSTSHASYTVRTLFPATTDGRPAVSYAFVHRTDELRYDTSPFGAGTGTVSLPTVVRQSADREDASTDPEELVRIRGAGYAHIQSRTEDVDNVGHALRQRALGREMVDQEIVSHQIPVLLGGAGQWLWRTERSWTDGDGDLELGHTTNTYDDETGDLIHTAVRAELTTDPYEFGPGQDPTDPDGGPGDADEYEQGNQTIEMSSTFDPWGTATASCGGANISGDSPDAATECLRYATIGLDEDYAQFPLEERTAILPGRASDDQFLITEGVWDRGLDAITEVSDPNGQTSQVFRDGLGRVTALLPPFIPDSSRCPGVTDPLPTVVIEYELTEEPSTQPVSRVVTTSVLECYATSSGPGQVQSIAYVDGLGRTRASLSTGDDASERPWVQSGVGVLTPRGTAERAHIADFLSEAEPTPAAAVALPATPYSRAVYDAFGRARAAIAEDGSATWTSYHSLSSDVCDPLDNDPSSPHYRTCTTARTDGHGRVVDQIQRNRQPGSTVLETYRLFTTYREDGAVLSITRAETAGDGTTDPLDASHVTQRQFFYDTIGRRVGSTDPDTDSRDGTQNATNRTWRYLFNRVGDLVAVRDPRGCGQNFYYDDGGRLLGERYVYCAEAQVPSEAPVEEVPEDAIGLDRTEAGVDVDVRYFFDDHPGWTSGLTVSGFSTDNDRGRPTGVSDRGQQSTVSYDVRGNVVWTGRLVSVIAPAGAADDPISGHDPSVPLGNAEGITPASVIYDGAASLGSTQALYQQETHYNHGNRVRSMTLTRGQETTGFPFTPPAGLGTGRITYNRRGLPIALEAELGDADVQSIISDIQYTADGLAQQVTYGDTQDGDDGERTPTVETTDYDIRRRPVRTRVTRVAALDSDPGTLPGVNGVVDQQLVWDVASNLVAVLDDRDPAEWPAGYRPQSINIEHDSLYRVVGARFDYTNGEGARTPIDNASDYRDEMLAVESMDPMRTRPAPVLPTLPNGRVQELSWQYDWLANMREWREPPTFDDGNTFYERELGTITNGDPAQSERPSALRLAVHLDDGAPGNDRGGWLSVDYGQGGNVVAMTVRARCEDAPMETCEDIAGTVTQRRENLRDSCVCAREQHYQYRWDELNRLAEARRYDRAGSGTWSLEARQRYRYDAANQRVVKETTDEIGNHRIALYPFPGDLERRGLERDAGDDAYVELSPSEDQFVIAGARFVQRSDGGDEGGFDPWNRATIAITDLIGSTSAVIDLRSGTLVETSTFYPNGATETYRAFQEDESMGDDFAPREPMGFTGKEGDEEVGLVYFGERYLIPRIGRWASPDPLHVHAMGGGEAGNSYHYVSGNLLQARDPLGLTCSGGAQGNESCSADDTTGNYSEDTGEVLQVDQPRSAPRQPARRPAPARPRTLADDVNEQVTPALQAVSDGAAAVARDVTPAVRQGAGVVGEVGVMFLGGPAARAQEMAETCRGAGACTVGAVMVAGRTLLDHVAGARLAEAGAEDTGASRSARGSRQSPPSEPPQGGGGGTPGSALARRQGSVVVEGRPHPAELEYARELSGRGHDVRVRGRHAAGADFEVDGRMVELKTLKRATRNAVSQAIRGARAQSGRIVVDGRAAGLRFRTAVQGVRHRLRHSGPGGITEIRVHSVEGDYVWSAPP
ncbi:MAG: VCBS repeat-containing protein [Deltaproteobacteria bacterium]|nr:VCBS repeat-containing protein [Deltaproteobacteria bacterium]